MDFKVFIACLDRRHAFQTATAAAESGVLDTFVTGAYFPNSMPFSRRLRMNRKGEDLRRAAHLAGATLRAVPHFLVPGKFISSIPFFSGGWARTAGFLASELAFDRYVSQYYDGTSDIFHGFGRYSPLSLQRARAMGTTTVLDAFELHPLDELELEARHRNFVGLPPLRMTKVRETSVGRRIEAYKHADVIFACLGDIKSSLVRRGVDANRIRIVPLGADVLDTTGLDEAKRGEGPFKLLYVGQLHWFKGLHLLLDSWDRLALPTAELIVVGRSFPEWGEYFERRMAGMTSVRWIPGLSRQDLFRLYSDVDAFAFPSLVGGLGMVVYEAMSHGLPVVVSSGDVVIRDEIDGLVAAPETPEALDLAISRLVGDSLLRLRLGLAGRERSTSFAWDRYHHAVVGAYESILSER